MVGGERYNSINNYLKKQFNGKTVKLSIEAGFTCPNRDGTVGYGGCAFCSSGGSGELASSISDQIELLSEKWPNATYLAYFQSHTNTYAPVAVLREKFYEALNDPRIEGIAIATRPDCLGDDVLDLLEEINDKYFLWVELGLQSIHAASTQKLNIGYDLDCYDKAVDALRARNIRVVTHLILGLPGETEEDMRASIDHIVRPVSNKDASTGGTLVNGNCPSANGSSIFGIKLHMLNIVKTSRLFEIMPDYQSFESIDSYTDLVVRMLEIIPPDVTIHRLTGDVPRKILVSPSWSYNKRTILNEINRKLRDNNTYQGRLCE
ncbi:MAG: TIGR01212 family radical SAM protein [Clostridiales bacterium]|jgi:radical SAM superfamily enzyme|nr:TIGR01212 family radical SAM protein [Clostridiales bacterium]